MNLYVKVSKILYEWILLLNPFGFCETLYLHFTTRMFGHSAITPFLGGEGETERVCERNWVIGREGGRQRFCVYVYARVNMCG